MTRYKQKALLCAGLYWRWRPWDWPANMLGFGRGVSLPVRGTRRPKIKSRSKTRFGKSQPVTKSSSLDLCPAPLMCRVLCWGFEGDRVGQDYALHSRNLPLAGQPRYVCKQQQNKAERQGSRRGQGGTGARRREGCLLEGRSRSGPGKQCHLCQVPESTIRKSVGVHYFGGP